MATISDELAAGLTKILQLAQLDIQNQDKLFNGNGDVTIARADGSTFSAATWAKMMAATVDNMKKRGSLGVNNLNEINGTLDGFWTQGATSNAIASRNYPEQIAGSLLVMQNATNNAAGCTQMYFPHNNNNCYVRTGIANASGISSWSTWQKLAFTSDPEFSGKVVMPGGMHLKKDKVILTAGDDNTLIITVGGKTDVGSWNGGGLYLPGTLDAVRGFKSHMGLGSASGNNLYCFGWDGTRMVLYVDNTAVGSLNTSSTSDRGLKKDIEYTPLDDRLVALEEVMRWATATFKMRARGDVIPESPEMLGFIANDLKAVSPECVSGQGLEEDDEPDPLKAYILEPIAMMAKMTLAMQAMEDQITDLQNTVKNLKEKVFSQ
ncbi:pyocin knob domain-containing S74 family peptidase [Superficieibacter sp. BNK-5]|uniref:pyocin knob domain-containing S74 family peptidase n=1 Tax=Superficieibacter sp. BNK-5 TaxID=3376142 RepID=UPI0039BFEC3F